MQRLLPVAAVLAAEVLSSARAGTGSVTVSNILPRVTSSGDIIDAHDGNVLYDTASGQYFYYAAGYGDCVEPPGLNGCASWCDGCGCGFYYNHSVNLYSSSDLVTWTAHGNVMPLGGSRPNAVLFSPKVIFNAKTQTYVLWMNFVCGPGWAEGRPGSLLVWKPALASRVPTQAAIQLRRRHVCVALRPVQRRLDHRCPLDAVWRPVQ